MSESKRAAEVKRKGYRLTPWQKIMLAASLGKGLRLSAREAQELSMDSAIEVKSENDYGNLQPVQEG